MSENGKLMADLEAAESAKLRLTEVRAAGIKTRNVRATLEWAADQADKQAAAWAGRRDGFREAIAAMERADAGDGGGDEQDED